MKIWRFSQLLAFFSTRMKESKIEIEESQKRPFVEGLRGEVFHVTLAKNLASIKKSTGILVNTGTERDTTFGDASNSIFRKKGCVSVFDYESPTRENWQKHMGKCNPLLRSDDDELAFLFLGENAKNNLIRWSQIENEWIGTRVVPHVEAGHLGIIALTDIKEIVVVKIIIDPNTLASKLKQAIKNANKQKNSNNNTLHGFYTMRGCQ